MAGNLIDAGVCEVKRQVMFTGGGVDEDATYPPILGGGAFAVVLGELSGVYILYAVMAVSGFS